LLLPFRERNIVSHKPGVPTPPTPQALMFVVVGDRKVKPRVRWLFAAKRGYDSRKTTSYPESWHFNSHKNLLA
jgi:hypothetical protein